MGRWEGEEAGRWEGRGGVEVERGVEGRGGKVLGKRRVLEGRGGLGKRGELKCYIHTDIHTDTHTDPLTKRVVEELLLLKSKSVNVKEGIFVYL